MRNSILKRRLAKHASYACAALLLFGGNIGFTACEDNLLTGTPTWLGSSIYEELESRGTFTQTLALINDPELSETNYPDLLRRSGSMTLFVAEDAACFLPDPLFPAEQPPRTRKKIMKNTTNFHLLAYLIP